MCGITSTSRMQLNSMLGAMGLSENQLRKEKLTTSATFLLLRLVRNLKGSQVTLFLIWIIVLKCSVGSLFCSWMFCRHLCSCRCTHHYTQLFRWSNCSRQWSKTKRCPNKKISLKSPCESVHPWSMHLVLIDWCLIRAIEICQHYSNFYHIIN